MEQNGGVVVIKFKADTSDLENAKKNIGNFSKAELAKERNELARQRIELSKQRNTISQINAQTKRLNANTKQYEAKTKRIKVNSDKLNSSVKNRINLEKLNLQAQKQQTRQYRTMQTSALKLNSVVSSIASKFMTIFSAVAILRFAKDCIEASSSLVEVQNVVENAFPTMSKEIDKWAENSSRKFGMSERAAKQYASTFGMIARSAGIGESDAYTLGTNLTALTADIGSLLNKSDEEVAEKLRSGVLSGMVRPMRDLGISMNEVDIQAWMTSKGIKENYRQMENAEKIAIRYNYVLEKTALMQGDYAHTSHTWANQTKQLKGNWEDLKAALGDFLRTALVPLLTGLNKLIERITLATKAFKQFLAEVFDIQFDTSGISSGADEIIDDLDGITDSAEDMEKALKRATGPLDQLNIISDRSSGSSSGSGSGASGLGFGSYDNDYKDTGSVMDTGKWNTISGIIERITGRFSELANIFGNSFFSTFNPENLGKIFKSIEGISKSIIDIFSDEQVQKASDNFANTIAESFGRVSANTLNIGASISYNVSEGFNRSLRSRRPKIKRTIEEVFDFEGQKSKMVADVSDSCAEIAKTFESEGSVRITAAIDGIIEDTGLTATRLWERLSTDIMHILVDPFTENSGKIAENLQKIHDYMAPIFESIEDFNQNAGEDLIESYDNDFHPMMEDIRDFFVDFEGFCNDIFGVLLDDTLPKFSEWVEDFKTNHLEPFWKSMKESNKETLKFLRKVLTALDAIVKIIVVLGIAVAAVIWDVVEPILEGLAETCTGTLEGIQLGIDGFFGTLNSMFEGDLKGILDNLIDIVEGKLLETTSVIDGAANMIIGIINNVFEADIKKLDLSGWVRSFFDAYRKAKEGVNLRDRGYSSSMDGYDATARRRSQSGSGGRGVGHFANGGVFMPNHEVVGVLGDNKYEREFALTESILDGIATRMATVQNNNAGTTIPNITMQVQIDGEWVDARILKVTESNSYRS